MDETKKDAGHDEVGHLFEITRCFRNGMLATIAEDGHLHGRPMAIIDVDSDAHAIWFMTLLENESCAEIARDPRAMVTLQDDKAYVQWSGRANLVDDPAKVAQLFSPALKLWFPDGPGDPEIVLVRVDVEIGEYWDQRGGLQIRTMVRRAKDAIQGRRADEPKDDPKEHARVRFENGHRAS